MTLRFIKQTEQNRLCKQKKNLFMLFSTKKIKIKNSTTNVIFVWKKDIKICNQPSSYITARYDDQRCFSIHLNVNRETPWWATLGYWKDTDKRMLKLLKSYFYNYNRQGYYSYNGTWLNEVLRFSWITSTKCI